MRDARGIQMTTADRMAVAHYDAAVLEFASMSGDPVATLDRALAADPDFAEAMAAKAALFCTTSDQPLEKEVAALVGAIDQMGDRASETARRHAAAARAWIGGDWHRGNALWGGLAMDQPHDLVAVQTAHLTDFLLGQSQMLRDRIAATLPAWSEDLPGYSYLHGMLAFGLEESGRYEAAEEAGLRALAMTPRDPWAIHAVAHVMEMQGRSLEGIRFLRDRQADWAEDCFFAYHNWWHLSLYHLDRGDTQVPLALYDEVIHPQPSEVAMELADAAALLWRLGLMGVDVGRRWDDVLASYAGRIDEGHYAFNDMHAMMAFVATGRIGLAERLMDAVTSRAEQGGSNGMMQRSAGLSVCRGLLAFGREEWETCVGELLLARPAAHRFGGSHAQRDVIVWTAMEAALRGKLDGRARGLLAERLTAKPESPFLWHQQARRLRAGGDEAGAEAAERRASGFAEAA
jgi:tetratricopeptide (TPR) repeat protein